jgi:hypothetical protein
LAAREAAERADRLLDGYHDLLGYCDVAVGVPPSWHADAIHGRTAPLGFWADVPFLDPACGDHKVIWELNRHQHWLALARAFQLTGNRRYYVEFVAQLESWLAANPPLTGINWASMLELAFRSLSWLWALHAFAPAVAGDPPGAPTWTIRLLTALDRQLDHILQNLSRYFSPNTHLMGEALALYIGGLALPELTASRRRVDVGRAVLLAEADRQIRADGGHAEQTAVRARGTAAVRLPENDCRRRGAPSVVRRRRRRNVVPYLPPRPGRLPRHAGHLRGSAREP